MGDCLAAGGLANWPPEADLGAYGDVGERVSMGEYRWAAAEGSCGERFAERPPER